jgi:hypothetical protein
MFSEIHLCDLYFLELNVFSIDTPFIPTVIFPVHINGYYCQIIKAIRESLCQWFQDGFVFTSCLLALAQAAAAFWSFLDMQSSGYWQQIL